MKIKNETPFGKAYLMKIVKFAMKFSYQKGKDTTIRFLYHPGEKTTGLAYIQADGYHVEYCIDINVGGGSKFPCTNVYKKSVGGVSLSSREEELILYLAHELRHVDVFAEWVTVKQSEVDAERHAHTVLGYWRVKKECKNVLTKKRALGKMLS